MGAKGSNDCCCGGCAEAPWDRSNTTRQFVQELQAFCCACLPKQICVTYQCGEDSATDKFDLARPCVEGDYKSVYRGELPIGGELVSLEFSFLVEYGVCYLCLTSAGLGVAAESEGACKEITSEVRAVLCPRCEACPEQEYDPTILEWDLGNDCLVRVSPPSLHSIKPLPRCCECPEDDCEGVPYEEPTCNGVCTGCGCICSEACITVLTTSGGAASEVVSICRNRWRTTSGVVISLVANSVTNCCELELSETGDMVADEEAANVAIGAGDNPCPDVIGQWEFVDTETSEGVIILFECATCRSCPGVTVATCCDTDATQLPRLLYANVDGGSGCCDSFIIPLIFTAGGVGAAWAGSSQTAMCGHPIALSLNCGEEWTLDFTGSPCVPQNITNYGGSCDPLNLVFTVPANGIGCCGGIASGTLTITITE